MKPLKTIKEAGLTVKSFKFDVTKFRNPLTGRSSKTAMFMFNAEGNIFCINDKPYCPIGRSLAFAEIIKAGLNNPAYSFQPYTIDCY